MQLLVKIPLINQKETNVWLLILLVQGVIIAHLLFHGPTFYLAVNLGYTVQR